MVTGGHGHGELELAVAVCECWQRRNHALQFRVAVPRAVDRRLFVILLIDLLPCQLTSLISHHTHLKRAHIAVERKCSPKVSPSQDEETGILVRLTV
jgi:hypothetical protein